MKKLLFLLIVLLVGFGTVFAGTIPAEPPDVFIGQMAEFGIHEDSVTQPAVLGLPITADPSSCQAVMAFNVLAIQPQSGIMNMITIFIPTLKAESATDYHLRL